MQDTQQDFESYIAKIPPLSLRKLYAIYVFRNQETIPFLLERSNLNGSKAHTSIDDIVSQRSFALIPVTDAFIVFIRQSIFR